MTPLPPDPVTSIEALRAGLPNGTREPAGSALDEAARSDHCGDFGIRILRDGTWLYHGSPIARKPLVRLFASVLRREAGAYWLVTPVERGRIAVDDAPFTAVAMTVEGAGPDQRITFETNLDESVTADSCHPIRVAIAPDTGEPRPYVEVRAGLEALILRPIYYDLIELGQGHLVAGEERYGVWSAGTFFPLA